MRKLFLQVARNEFLSLLSMMVRSCEHESWSDLTVLLNDDPEKDFFENMKHIQVRKFHVNYFVSLHFQLVFCSGIERYQSRGKRKGYQWAKVMKCVWLQIGIHSGILLLLAFFSKFGGQIGNHKIVGCHEGFFSTPLMSIPTVNLKKHNIHSFLYQFVVSFVQLHRRVRALRLLQLHCQKHTFKTTTLTSYLLPLATRCIFENKDSHLVSEGITTIGAISAILPWFHYCNLLRHYLKLLPLEKNAQKVIVR